MIAPLVAIALNESDVRKVVAQQITTTSRPSPVPDWPMIHESRMKRMMPRMFCVHGTKTPRKVPILAGGAAAFLGSAPPTAGSAASAGPLAGVAPGPSSDSPPVTRCSPCARP